MMLASSDQFGDAARCLQIGVREYLMKPIRRAELLEAIRRTLQPPASQSAATPLDAGAAPAVHARILLAEDNLVNQRVALGLLTRRGHTVDVANNGLEALAALRRASYDLILMDIQMPEMGGIEATRLIRQHESLNGGHTAIFAMTAHAMKGDRERYLASGMDGYLPKPIDHRALFAAIEALVPNTRPAAAAPAADAPPTAEALPVPVPELRS
jgi:CheY-like chemotaxis protein